MFPTPPHKSGCPLRGERTRSCPERALLLPAWANETTSARSRQNSEGGTHMARVDVTVHSLFRLPMRAEAVHVPGKTGSATRGVGSPTCGAGLGVNLVFRPPTYSRTVAGKNTCPPSHFFLHKWIRSQALFTVFGLKEGARNGTTASRVHTAPSPTHGELTVHCRVKNVLDPWRIPRTLSCNSAGPSSAVFFTCRAVAN